MEIKCCGKYFFPFFFGKIVIYNNFRKWERRVYRKRGSRFERRGLYVGGGMTRGIGQRTAERAMFVPMVTARKYPREAENDY